MDIYSKINIINIYITKYYRLNLNITIASY